MRKVEATINIGSSSATVFNAFIEPLQLKKWWGVDRCLIETKQGGIYSLTWNINNQGFQYISTGVITVYQPAEELLIVILSILILKNHFLVLLISLLNWKR